MALQAEQAVDDGIIALLLQQGHREENSPFDLDILPDSVFR